MIQTTLVVITLIVSTLLFSFTAPQVYACSCAITKSATEAFDSASAVFAGKVLSRDIQSSGQPGWNTASPFKVTLEVSQVWKGPKDSTIDIFTANLGASCGYTFNENQQYLVYAYPREGGTLETGLCSRTKSLANAKEDVTQLNRLMSSTESNIYTVVNGGLLGGVIAAISFGLFLLLKRIIKKSI